MTKLKIPLILFSLYLICSITESKLKFESLDFDINWDIVKDFDWDFLKPQDLFESSDPDIFKSLKEITLDGGYLFEEHKVTTKDGYHLIIFRIPGR